MDLIVGLGNPSPKYDRTRHNAGREAVEHWLKGQEVQQVNVPNFSGQAFRITSHNLPTTHYPLPTIIVPDLGTFMNESGPAVAKLLSYYKIPPENLIVVHDDLSFALGEVRLQKNLSAAGHNGVESIVSALGTQGFARLRLGVESRPNHQLPSEDFVLQKFADSEKPMVKEMLSRVATALNSIITNGIK